MTWHPDPGLVDVIDGLSNGTISVDECHADIFEATADCRSRSFIRSLAGVSRDAAANHNLFVDQLRLVHRLVRALRSLGAASLALATSSLAPILQLAPTPPDLSPFGPNLQ